MGGLEGKELYRSLLDAVKYSVTVQSELRDTVANLNNSVEDLKGAISSLANRNDNELQNHTNQLKIKLSLHRQFFLKKRFDDLKLIWFLNIWALHWEQIWKRLNAAFFFETVVC